MRGLLIFLVFVLVAGGFVVSQSVFIVGVTDQAVVLELGRHVRTINQWRADEDAVEGENEAGLHWKIPFLQQVEMFDRRSLTVDVPGTSVTTASQQRIEVDAFARYRITDPLQFYRSVRDESGAEERLSPILDGALRGVLGDVLPNEIISGQRVELMGRIRDRANRGVSGELDRAGEEELAAAEGGDEAFEELEAVESVNNENLGVEIIDVRIRRADLPLAITDRVLERMRTERQQEAQLRRARGQEEAERIRANADRQATVERANAERDALRIRGEADAEATRIFNLAYNVDPEFFDFYRSMSAYNTAIAENRTILTSPERDFFRYFFDESGGGN